MTRGASTAAIVRNERRVGAPRIPAVPPRSLKIFGYGDMRRAKEVSKKVTQV